LQPTKSEQAITDSTLMTSAVSDHPPDNEPSQNTEETTSQPLAQEPEETTTQPPAPVQPSVPASTTTSASTQTQNSEVRRRLVKDNQQTPIPTPIASVNAEELLGFPLTQQNVKIILIVALILGYLLGKIF